MNVLYIIGGEGNRYGSEIIAIDLISAGSKNGINYTVITAKKGAVTEACNKMGVECYTVPFSFFVYKKPSSHCIDFIKKTIWRCRAELLTFIAIKYIERKIDLRTIDIIHTNLSRDLLGGLLAKKYNIPHIWHIHEMFNAHYQLSFLREDQLSWMVSHSNKFVAISQTVAMDWIRNGIPKGKVIVIHNGIDFSTIKSKKSHNENTITKLVMVGHICPAKGQEYVIRELSDLPSEYRARITIDFYGDGNVNYILALKKLSKELDVKVYFRGYNSNVGQELYKYDIGINCSKGEGFGLSIVEYMAAGICAVVANTGANTEIVEDNVNGCIFDYNKEHSLGNLLISLMNDKQKSIAVSERGRDKVLSSFSVSSMQQRVYSVYENVEEKANDIE